MDSGTGDDDQRATLQRLLEKIRQLPDEPYQKFDFTLTELGDVIFGFQESSGYKIDARVLSDGTLRTLAILTAFETVSEGSRIVVEEFDNGLHPSRVGVLTEAIAEVAKNRRFAGFGNYTQSSHYELPHAGAARRGGFMHLGRRE